MSFSRIVFILLAVPACRGMHCSGGDNADTSETDHAEHQQSDVLPQLEPQPLDANERLRVVASTNIVADVVAQIGGDAIDLTALMPPGVDPHGFEPTPQDRIALEKAHVVFVNGLGLEESMLSVLESSDGSGVIVPVNTGFAVLEFDNETDHEDHADEDHADEDHGHEHGGDDPHTWFSVHAVEQWVENVEHVLSELDPENAETYAANAEGYRSELEILEGELAAMVAELLPEQRKMVTDHESFGYFADEYDFEIIGTVMPVIEHDGLAVSGTVGSTA